MTTLNTDLQEQIARAIHASDAANGYAADEYEEMSAEAREWYALNAAAVLPIVDAAVKRGQAEAWDEGAQAQADTYGGQVDTGPNPYRETGDSDEHR